MVGYMCMWSATCVVGYMCGRLHVWSATCVVSYMCGQLHVWSATCVVMISSLQRGYLLDESGMDGYIHVQDINSHPEPTCRH